MAQHRAKLTSAPVVPEVRRKAAKVESGAAREGTVGENAPKDPRPPGEAVAVAVRTTASHEAPHPARGKGCEGVGGA